MVIILWSIHTLPTQTPVVVVGNKYDLDGIRDVDVTVSTQWAKTNGGKSL